MIPLTAASTKKVYCYKIQKIHRDKGQTNQNHRRECDNCIELNRPSTQSKKIYTLISIYDKIC